MCDMNSVPHTYVLQPVSSHIQGYLSHDAEQRRLAFQQWTGIFTRIQKILRREARNLFGDQGGEQVHKYFMSGIVTQHCIAAEIHRVFQTILICLEAIR